MRPSLATVVLLASLAQAAPAQSTRLIGGGCPNRGAPAVQGPLLIGTTLEITSVGCFTGQGGFGALFFGTPLPRNQWVPFWLSSSVAGFAFCDLSVLPWIGIDVTNANLPLRVFIPNDPNLRGFELGLQAFCNECGFAGCYDLLTAGLGVTFG
jgi:hypothetical protein